MRLLTSTIKALREQWSPPRDRVLWAPVFLGIGIALYFSRMTEPSGLACALMLAAAGLAVLAAWRRKREWLYPCVCLFLVAAGFAAGHARTVLVASPMLERTINITKLEGRVLEISVADEELGKKARRRVTLNKLWIEKLGYRDTPEMLSLSTYHVPADVVPGERIGMYVKLMPPSGPVVPGGFDFRRQAYFNQSGAVGFTLGKFERIAPVENAPNTWFSTLRQIIAKRINAVLPHPESAVTMALLAGERASIPKNVNQDLIDSGLYHLLSISGLHVAIVCGVTFFTLRFMMALWPWFALHVPIKKIAALGALGIGLFYVMLAGSPIPAQRSLIMSGMVLVAIIFDRSALSMRTIALAAFFLLLLMPESLVGPSFQLSFAAVLSMIAFHEDISRHVLVTHRGDNMAVKIIYYLLGIGVTTVLVTLATLPIILHHFGRFQLYGVLANAAAIPLTSFIVMPAGMVAMLMMPLGLEEPFLRIASWGVTATLDVSHAVANMPHAVMAWPSLPQVPFLISCFGFLFACLWRGNARWIGLPVMLIAIVSGFFMTRPIAMLDSEGRSLAAAGGGQVAYAYKTPTAFVRKNWVALWGGDEANSGKPLRQWQDGDASVACDDFACRVGDFSILKSRTVLGEECASVKTVVALDRAVRRRDQADCKARLLTGWHVFHGGGLAFYADGRVEPMIPEKERRPWTRR